MPESKSGRVTSIAMNAHKLSFALDRKNNERFVIYDEAPNTQTIPQFELATRSWMLALLQTAFTSTKELVVKYDDNQSHSNYVVHQIELNDPLHINIPPGSSTPVKVPVGNASKPIAKKKAK